VVGLILKRLGFEVAEAGTVADAVAALDRRPDWVLLDLMLPDGCGTHVLRKAKSQAQCRVCVVSGCGPERLDAARALAPDAVFNKPLDVDRLLRTLTAARA
jgi:DNA-binding response OmpR family regulator